MKMKESVFCTMLCVMLFAMNSYAESLVETQVVWPLNAYDAKYDTSCKYILEAVNDECRKYIADASSEQEESGCVHRLETLVTPTQLVFILLGKDLEKYKSDSETAVSRFPDSTLIFRIPAGMRNVAYLEDTEAKSEPLLLEPGSDGAIPRTEFNHKFTMKKMCPSHH
ncbi:hypothetical protein [Endozoicomonas arenosclerae]|uniref:hypothetical protein n=1 Tax=Endozoicomonas arenosclerae TaxID=1633495 RepID=UPI0007807863|nr:hypothetical protein [Endozoicomonas arenosclerae]